MIRSFSTSCLCDEAVEVRLPCFGVDKSGDGATALENRLVEQVVVLAIISNKLHSQGTGTGRLAPNGDLASVATKGSDVVLNPLEGHALVSESNVSGTSSLHLLAEEESPLCKAVVDGNGNDRLLFLD